MYGFRPTAPRQTPPLGALCQTPSYASFGRVLAYRLTGSAVRAAYDVVSRTRSDLLTIRRWSNSEGRRPERMVAQPSLRTKRARCTADSRLWSSRWDWSALWLGAARATHPAGLPRRRRRCSRSPPTAGWMTCNWAANGTSGSAAYSTMATGTRRRAGPTRFKRAGSTESVTRSSSLTRLATARCFNVGRWRPGPSTRAPDLEWADRSLGHSPNLNAADPAW